MFIKTLIPPLVMSALATLGVLLLKTVCMSDTVIAHVLFTLAFLTIYAGLSWRRPSIRETVHLIIRGLPITLNAKMEAV